MLWILLRSIIIYLAIAKASYAECLVIAHRGASLDAPENTLAAFNHAWEEGADGIEADFRLTRDKRLICIHDASTSDVAVERRNIVETDFSTLRKFDVGSWKHHEFGSERMPTLDEVLSTTPVDKLVFVELKEDWDLTAPFLAELNETDFPISQLRVISFEPAIIKQIEAKRPELTTSLLISLREQQGILEPSLAQIIHRAQQIGADAVSLSARSSIDRKYIEQLNQAGLRVHVWTVDHPAIARYFAEIGVDSITTNDPETILEALREKDPGENRELLENSRVAE